MLRLLCMQSRKRHSLHLKGDPIVLEEIPQGHKIALIDLNKGDHVIKYGYPIGHLLSDVKAGQWLHTHNVKTNLSGTLAYTYEPNLQPVVYPKSQLTFKGYR